MLTHKHHLKLAKRMHVILQRILFEEFDDPSFKKISINFLKLNGKKTLATVYLDIENASEESRIIKKLDILKPHLRRRLGNELSRFKPPFLKFVDDVTFKQAMKIQNLLKNSNIAETEDHD